MWTRTCGRRGRWRGGKRRSKYLGNILVVSQTPPPEKTAVITGGASGIGFETAKALCALGWRVVITGRDEAKLQSAIAALQAMRNGAGQTPRASHAIGDFTSFASVRALAARLAREERIDALMNNIGVALSHRRVTQDGNEQTLQVNHLSPFLLTNLLLDKLQASAPARIVNISSHVHRTAKDHGFGDFQFERSYSALKAYARTKLYNILFTRELARRLTGTRVTANAVHPGGIKTRIGMDGDMTGYMRAVMAVGRLYFSPLETGGKVPVFAATAPELDGVTGAYISTDLKIEEPSPLALNAAAARRLWDLSAETTGLGEGARLRM